MREETGEGREERAGKMEEGAETKKGRLGVTVGIYR